MIVFVSDLHISDKTTGVQHLDRGAFELALPAIAAQADKAGKDGVQTDVTFVFLGDIFDMVRTDYWFKHPEVRPWDFPPGTQFKEDSKVAATAEILLKKIIKASRDIFDIWSQPLKDDKRFGFTKEPRRVYIPGNHDRICNQFVRLRKLVIKELGLNLGLPEAQAIDPKEPFPHYFYDGDYKVFARHGQEWDDYNFEHVVDWSQEGYITPPFEHYMEIPIGEVIAAEVASRLPMVVGEKLEGKLKREDVNRIVEHMKTIDDVRPMAAILPWLFDSIKTQPVMCNHQGVLLPALSEAINEVVTKFDELDYTQQWMDKHDVVSPWDYVDRLQGAILALKHLDVRTMGRILRMLETRPAQAAGAILRLIPCLNDALANDNYVRRAIEDDERIKKEYQALYLLYGHTHKAEQVPLVTSQSGGCTVYLNTGTWRPLYRQTVAEVGFMRWKNLTYTIFYNPQDDPGSQAGSAKAPIFETWTGSLLDPLD